MSNAKGHKIAVAMSGGVDSSVAAALLLRQGYDVSGVTMITTNTAGTGAGADGLQESAAVRAARDIAGKLGIPHYAVDVVDFFGREIIEYFEREYAEGRTPNPCVRCNRLVKFGMLFEKARDLGADDLATGHYARIDTGDDGVTYRLKRGVDRNKDQSYMLANLTQEQLRHALFPLGDQTKDRTREIAAELGIADVHLPDSQEVCFVPQDDYGAFLTSRGQEVSPGPIFNVRGEQLGTHRGLIYYTVGQRKGLGIAAPKPLYVLRLDPKQNALIVGYEEETACSGLIAGDVNWISGEPPYEPFECEVQVRYRQRAVPCTVIPRGEQFTVRFHQPIRGVAPGQWAALYDGVYVIGGGVIQDSLPLEA